MSASGASACDQRRSGSGRQLRGELEQPGPTVRPFVAARGGGIEICAFAADFRGRQLPVEQGPDVGRDRRPGEPAQHARQQPIAMHAGVPIEAAEEHGMQRLGRARVLWPGEHVPGLVRILAGDVAERDPGEPGGEVGGERRQHRGEASRSGRLAHRGKLDEGSATLRAGRLRHAGQPSRPGESLGAARADRAPAADALGLAAGDAAFARRHVRVLRPVHDRLRHPRPGQGGHARQRQGRRSSPGRRCSWPSTFAGLFIGTFVFGFVADRYGRRAIFTCSLLFYCAATLIMAFQNTGLERLPVAADRRHRHRRRAGDDRHLHRRAGAQAGARPRLRLQPGDPVRGGAGRGASWPTCWSRSRRSVGTDGAGWWRSARSGRCSSG